MKSFHEGSGRHLYAIPIPFKFTFFGALRENVTISTEGFLSFKDNGAPIDLLKLQQVSALRADFKLTKDSDVRYVATDDTLVVEWKDLVLQNSSTHIKQNATTFKLCWPRTTQSLSTTSKYLPTSRNTYTTIK